MHSVNPDIIKESKAELNRKYTYTVDSNEIIIPETEMASHCSFYVNHKRKASYTIQIVFAITYFFPKCLHLCRRNMHLDQCVYRSWKEEQIKYSQRKSKYYHIIYDNHFQYGIFIYSHVQCTTAANSIINRTRNKTVL